MFRPESLATTDAATMSRPKPVTRKPSTSAPRPMKVDAEIRFTTRAAAPGSIVMWKPELPFEYQSIRSLVSAATVVVWVGTAP